MNLLGEATYDLFFWRCWYICQVLTLSSGWQRLMLCATFRGYLQTPMPEWLLELRKAAEPRAGSVLPDGCRAAPAILPWCLNGHRHGSSDLAKHVVLRAAAVTVISGVQSHGVWEAPNCVLLRGLLDQIRSSWLLGGICSCWQWCCWGGGADPHPPRWFLKATGSRHSCTGGIRTKPGPHSGVAGDKGDQPKSILRQVAQFDPGRDNWGLLCPRWGGLPVGRHTFLGG